MLNNPITSRFPTIKSHTFTDAAGAGAIGTVAVFTITGTIIIDDLVCLCTTSLTGATATIELGIAGDTNVLSGQLTATDWDADELMADNEITPGPGSIILKTQPTTTNVGGAGVISQVVDASIIWTVATAGIESGAIDVMCHWRPMSADGNLVAA